MEKIDDGFEDLRKKYPQISQMTADLLNEDFEVRDKDFSAEKNMENKDIGG